MATIAKCTNRTDVTQARRNLAVVAMALAAYRAEHGSYPPALGALPIGGTFRPDNVEGFVRLLTVTLGVRAEARGADETVLWRGR